MSHLSDNRHVQGDPGRLAAPPDGRSDALRALSAGPAMANIPVCPTRGICLSHLKNLPAHGAVVLDLPLDSRECRNAFIRVLRELDISASLCRKVIDGLALTWYGGPRGIEHYSAEDRRWVPALGLAGGHTLPELVEGCKLEGAEGLVAAIPNEQYPGWYTPIAYLNYWTDVHVPHHMEGLMKLVRAQLGEGEKFALADTVVCVDSAPKGTYRALLAHAVLEWTEKASARGISKVYGIVRLDPNPNPAIGAHRAVGWTDVACQKGKPLELFEDVVSEAMGKRVEGRFQVVVLDLKSPQLAEHIERARLIVAENNFHTVDLDGNPQTFQALSGS